MQHGAAETVVRQHRKAEKPSQSVGCRMLPPSGYAPKLLTVLLFKGALGLAHERGPWGFGKACPHRLATRRRIRRIQLELNE